MVDGQAEKDREVVHSTSVVFNSDSQHLAYVARVPKNFWGFSSGDCVVIDGNEGSIYDEIYASSVSGYLFFYSPNQLHYLARKNDEIYLVEEQLS